MAGDGSPNFDTNTWYQITESRVDFNSSLQLVAKNPTNMFMGQACDTCLQYWQIIPSTFSTSKSANGSFVLRNRATGTSRQLGVCHVPEEQDGSKTKPCMYSSDNADEDLGGAFAKWDITNWPYDGTLKLTNVGNGTNYNLDCHKGNPMFLSSDTARLPRQDAQHWLFSSVGVINDETYSTGIPAAASSTSSPTPSSTSSHSSSSSGLFPGAAAGIGIAVGVAVLAAIIIGLFFLRQRRRKRRQPVPSEESSGIEFNNPNSRSNSNQPATTYTAGGYGQVDHKYQGTVQEGPPHELSGISTAELPGNEDVAREMDAKHSRLGSPR